ncbi:MAG: XdhC family protein [Chloroflexi bacterium]|nr:XdhC family protein [Chloroflexota bacterium]
MATDREFFAQVVQSLSRGEPLVLATVVKASGSVPRGVGSRMLVWRSGAISGTVGGGTMEERVIQESQAALADGRSRQCEYLFASDAENSVGLCGGQAEVFLRVIMPS